MHQAHTNLQMDHNHAASETMSSADPEAQDWAKQRLAKSPRHQEWVKIKYKPAGGGAEREVSAFVVYPEVKSKATAVVVIHEIFGMSDWVQILTDELAEAGYVAIAPDLLSGMGRITVARAMSQPPVRTRLARRYETCLQIKSLLTWMRLPPTLRSCRRATASLLRQGSVGAEVRRSAMRQIIPR